MYILNQILVYFQGERRVDSVTYRIKTTGQVYARRFEQKLELFELLTQYVVFDAED